MVSSELTDPRPGGAGRRSMERRWRPCWMTLPMCLLSPQISATGATASHSPSTTLPWSGLQSKPGARGMRLLGSVWKACKGMSKACVAAEAVWGLLCGCWVVWLLLAAHAVGVAASTCQALGCRTAPLKAEVRQQAQSLVNRVTKACSAGQLETCGLNRGRYTSA